MGRTLENKKEIVAELKALLQDAQMALVIDYQGLSVSELTDLRDRLRPTGAVCKITKNTLMRIAVDGNETWQPITEFMEGTSAFLLLKDDLGGAHQSLPRLPKRHPRKPNCAAAVSWRVEPSVKPMSRPSLSCHPKEELMAQIAGALKATTTQLAVGLNAVPTQLAVGPHGGPCILDTGDQSRIRTRRLTVNPTIPKENPPCLLKLTKF